MFRSSWLNKKLDLSSSRSQRRRKAAPKHKPIRLCLEALEDRVVPATGTVVNSGAELLTALGPGGNVAVTLGQSFTLTNNSTGSVEIAKGTNLTITGAGFTLTAHGGNSRLFKVDAGASLTVDNATLTGGNWTMSKATDKGGGAIWDAGGTVTLSGATVKGNSVTATKLAPIADGGGVFVTGGGSLTIKNGSSIAGNTAVGVVASSATKGNATSNGAHGGGVYISNSSLDVNGSSISGNLAKGADPIVVGGGSGFAFGGGVFLMPGSHATFTSSDVFNNTAQGGRGFTGAGGGNAGGGGVFASGATSTLTFSGNVKGTIDRVYGNKAIGGVAGKGTTKVGAIGGTGGTGGFAVGGGLFANIGTLKVTGTSFTGNFAVGGTGGTGGTGSANTGMGFAGGNGGAGGFAVGGGIAGAVSGTASFIVNSSITGNFANAGMGGNAGTGGAGTTTGGKGGIGGAGNAAVGGGFNLSVPDGVLLNIINTTIATNQANGGTGGTGGAGGKGTTGGDGATGATGARGDGSGGGGNVTGTGTIQLINDMVYGNSVTGAPKDYTTGTMSGGVNATSAFNVFAYNSLFLNNTNPAGIADENVVLFFGSNLTTASFPPGIGGVPQTVVGTARTLNGVTNGLVYYPLLSGTNAVNLAGSTPSSTTFSTGKTIAATIAAAEGVTLNPFDLSNITDEIGNVRFTNNGTSVDAGAVSFSTTVSPESATTITVQNVNVTTSQTFTPITLNATVTAASGNPVEEGTVTFTVTTASGTVVGSSVTVPWSFTTPGLFTTGPGLGTSFILPGNTPAGTYDILASFSDPFNPATGVGGKFAASDNTPNPAVLTITAAGSTSPTITQQPASQTVLVGNSALFTATATGTPSPTVQWEVSTDGGKTFTAISGATSTSYTASNVTTAMNGNQYEAVFTNSGGSTTTNSALLTVTSPPPPPPPVTMPPTITLQPSSQSATAGDTVLFTSTATGNPSPTEQWEVSTDGGTKFTPISGATNPTLTLSSVTTAMSGNQYEAVFTNSAGTATSIAALLTVKSSTVAPTISLNPVSQTVTLGNNVVFSATATGTPTPSLQWMVSTNGGKSFSTVVGATNTTLTLTNASTSMNGYQYEAVFTNSAGTATTTAAQLTVNAPPASPSSSTSSSTSSSSNIPASFFGQSPLQVAITVAIDTAAILLANNPSALASFNSLSQIFLGHGLPPTDELLTIIQSDLVGAAPATSFGLQLGYSIALSFAATQST